MSRLYAGQLGMIAFVTVVARGLLHGRTLESTLLTAALYLPVFALLGYVAGKVAANAVDESVQQQLNDQIAAMEAAINGENATEQPG